MIDEDITSRAVDVASDEQVRGGQEDQEVEPRLDAASLVQQLEAEQFKKLHDRRAAVA